jgi:hypothetical protein
MRTVKGRMGARRGLALVVAIATTTGAVIATALPASAQKLYESTRYSSVNQPISNWTTFASDGTPIAKDPNCPSYPGIKRSSKVWATAYGVDEPLHTDFRMQFHTTYSYGTAAAMLSYQNAGLPVSCSIVGLFQNATAQQARTWMTCGYLTQKRPPVRRCVRRYTSRRSSRPLRPPHATTRSSVCSSRLSTTTIV